eukprot:766625-Hanusia_phi.AAC.2
MRENETGRRGRGETTDNEMHGQERQAKGNRHESRGAEADWSWRQDRIGVGEERRGGDYQLRRSARGRTSHSCAGGSSVRSWGGRELVAAAGGCRTLVLCLPSSP